MYTFNYNANIESAIGYRLLLVASISDIGTCQKLISVHLYLNPVMTSQIRFQTMHKNIIVIRRCYNKGKYSANKLVQ